MSYQLTTAKVWDGSAWVAAVGGAQPWFSPLSNSDFQSASQVVTADALANTKGAWTELVSSTTAESTAVRVTVSGVNQSGVFTATLLDIGVGASGSESAVASNICVAGASDVSFYIPLRIGSGERVSARIQSAITGGKTATVAVRLFSWGSATDVPTSVDVLGTDTSTSAGTAGQNAVWTEVVASTTTAYRAFVLVGAIGSFATSNTTVPYSLGIGPAGSETQYGQWNYQSTVTEAVTSLDAEPPVVAVDVPSGSRLSFRHDQFSNGFRYAVTVIGVP